MDELVNMVMQIQEMKVELAVKNKKYINADSAN